MKRTKAIDRSNVQRNYNVLGEYFCGPGQAVWGGTRTHEQAQAIHDEIMAIIQGRAPSPIPLRDQP